MIAAGFGLESSAALPPHRRDHQDSARGRRFDWR
jgi:hypothetical protein